MSETYTMPPDGWVCFHCGERFKKIGSAEDHFGKRPGRKPACLIKAGDERGLVMALTKAEAAREKAEARVATIRAECAEVARAEERGAERMQRNGMRRDEQWHASAAQMAARIATAIERTGESKDTTDDG